MQSGSAEIEPTSVAVSNAYMTGTNLNHTVYPQRPTRINALDSTPSQMTEFQLDSMKADSTNQSITSHVPSSLPSGHVTKL